MTIVASDDFEIYANTAALEAVWPPAGSTADYNHVTWTGGGGAAAVAANQAYPDYYRFVRRFTTADGLLPSTTYTVTADMSAVGIRAFLSAASVNWVGTADYVAAGASGTATVIATSSAAGDLYVAIGLDAAPRGYFDYVGSMSCTAMAIDDGVAAPVFTSSLPVIGADWDTIAYTAGVITQGDVVVGLTRGALRFDPGETWQVQEYDGNFVGIVASHELTAQRPRFIGSFLPVGPRNLAFYLPASTPSGTQDAVIVTPTVPGTVLAAGNYTQNLTVTWPLLDGGTIAVTFPYAFWQRYEFTPENKGELLVPCEILGVPLTSTTAPYYITVTEPGTYS